MPIGYNGRKLVEKLGIRPGDVFAFVNAPQGYDRTLGKLPAGAKLGGRSRKLNFVQIFSKDRTLLRESLPHLMDRLEPNGMIWISWPKKASEVETDLTEKLVREIGLENGLVDVKVCSVDDRWSGLKFVRRMKDRGASSIDV